MSTLRVALPQQNETFVRVIDAPVGDVEAARLTLENRVSQLRQSGGGEAFQSDFLHDRHGDITVGAVGLTMYAARSLMESLPADLASEFNDAPALLRSPTSEGGGSGWHTSTLRAAVALLEPAPRQPEP
eukprot:4868087-Prymnesium_polylepis.1